MKNKKIILFHNIITPTRTLLFNKLHKQFKSQGYDFKIIFTSQTEGNRSWKIENEIKKFNFDYKILNSKQIQNKSNNDNHFFHINRGIKDLLNKENPDIIIHAGRASLSAWQTCYWSKKNNKKFILWSGSTKYENSWRRIITKPLVKRLIKNSTNYRSYGTRASEYLQILGSPKDKIQKLYNTVDIDFFLHESEKLKDQKQELKLKYGITTKYVMLFVGQLIGRKGIYEILDGFSEFQKTHNDISLVFAGNGSEKEKMQEIIQQKNIKNVFFPGFFQIDTIGEMYAIADIFTLPSIEEVWGLVINEAMCFGLPILTAHKVGASVDLVEEGRNGYIMKENTAKEVYSGLEFIFNNGLVEKNDSLSTVKKLKIKKIISDLNI